MKIRKKMYETNALITIRPTSKGFSVYAEYQKDPLFVEHFLRTGIKEGEVNDHHRTELHRALDAALDWLQEELLEER